MKGKRAFKLKFEAGDPNRWDKVNEHTVKKGNFFYIYVLTNAVNYRNRSHSINLPGSIY